jgi:hypothetical protein
MVWPNKRRCVKSSVTKHFGTAEILSLKRLKGLFAVNKFGQFGADEIRRRNRVWVGGGQIETFNHAEYRMAFRQAHEFKFREAAVSQKIDSPIGRFGMHRALKGIAVEDAGNNFGVKKIAVSSGLNDQFNAHVSTPF